MIVDSRKESTLGRGSMAGSTLSVGWKTDCTNCTCETVKLPGRQDARRILVSLQCLLTMRLVIGDKDPDAYTGYHKLLRMSLVAASCYLASSVQVEAQSRLKLSLKVRTRARRRI